MSDNSKPSIFKSRHLSVSKLFETLQEEFIVCELRVKIYPHDTHKKYWNEVAQKKKEKILDIAKKNNLFSIFDDIRVKSDFEKKIIPEIGFPQFIYRDDNQRFVQEKWDIHNYYLKSSSVKILVEGGEMLYGIIEFTDFKNKKIKVKIKDKFFEFDIEAVTRVL